MESTWIPTIAERVCWIFDRPDLIDPERRPRLDPELLAQRPWTVDDDCWIWQGSTTGPSGYGQVRWDRRLAVAHRLAYWLAVDPTIDLFPGRVGDPTVLDHVECDRKLCVNPAHLIETSHRANLSRRGGASQFVGVSRHPRGVWQSQIRVDGVQVKLGYFDSETAAARRYDAAMTVIDGSRPNHDRWPDQVLLPTPSDLAEATIRIDRMRAREAAKRVA